MSVPFPLSVEVVAATCHGERLAGRAGDFLPTFSTDSRTLRSGDTFIALVGPRFDGHAFVHEAASRGAKAAIVSDRSVADMARSLGLAVILVEDTLEALQALAHHVRRASRARVVAITGSAGKTTTKEASAALLSARFRTMRNRGNLNNHIGLPLSLLDLQGGAEVAVVELGMNHAGEISQLVRIAEPDVRVWTNVGTAHLAAFGSVDAIADAKAEILEGASRDSVLIVNADDPMVMARASAFAGRTVTFGTDAFADVQAVEIRDGGVEGQEAELRTPMGRARVTVMLPGRGHLQNVLAAVAVALQFGVPLGEIAERVGTLTASEHRGEIVRLARGIRVLDDCYNSSPDALARTLDVMRASAASGRKIAVLGEMLELGDQSEALHREGGRAVAQAGISRLVTVGGSPARALGEAAREAGLASDAVFHVGESEEAARGMGRWVSDHDLVLVKGSRGIRLERVIERLKVEFA